MDPINLSQDVMNTIFNQSSHLKFKDNNIKNHVTFTQLCCHARSFQTTVGTRKCIIFPFKFNTIRKYFDTNA